METEEFSYSDFWDERDRKEEKKTEKEVMKTRGKPRRGIKGRYLKPKNYISRRSSIKTMRVFNLKEKKIE